MSVVGHSNCPRDFEKQGYQFTYFTRPGLTIRQFQRDYLDRLLATPTDKIILFLFDNELRHDLPCYIYAKFRSLYFFLRNRVCYDIVIVDILPRKVTPYNGVTPNEINRRRALTRNYKIFIRHFSIPFVPLRFVQYLPLLKPDGIHLTYEGRQLLRQEILQKI